MAELELCDYLKLESCDFSENPDAVSVEIINSGGGFSSIIDDIPAEKNLITIAVRNYMKALGMGGRFVFSITKNIPSGAGLGGGSSNAAAALKIVSEILCRDYDSELLQAASLTGSDVPFFLHGGFGFVEGKGELFTPLDFYDGSYILLVNNGIHVNTGFAYETLNKPVSETDLECEEKKRILFNGIKRIEDWKKYFKNDFEEVIFDLHPQIGLIKQNMYKNGAFFSSMTGSGSTVFGIFNNKESAVSARKIFENGSDRVFLTNFRDCKN